MPSFKQRSMDVEAVRLRSRARVAADTGAQEGKPGDWLVTWPGVGQAVLSDKEFRARFEAQDQDGRRALAEKLPWEREEEEDAEATG